MASPWFVFAFAAFPTLFIFIHNYGETTVVDMLLPLAGSVGVAAVLMGAMFGVRRDWKAAGVATAILVVWFFSFRFQWAILYRLPVDPSVGQAVALTATAAGVLAGLVLWRPGVAHPLVRPLNTFAIILLGISGLNLASRVVLTPDPGDIPAVTWPEPASAEALSEEPVRDIYYVVLDGYARADVLREVWGYDNSRFLGQLERAGFHVFEEARANYIKTYLSLASSLNGRYLDDVAAQSRGRGEGQNQRVPFELIHRNAVMEFLRQRGYTIYNFRTWWGPTKKLRAADVNVGCGRRTGGEFQRVLLSYTPIWGMESQIPTLVNDYEGQLCLLQKLLGIHEEPGPKFVFAHILTPHPPAVFGPDGEPARVKPALLGDAEGAADREGYLGEVTFINRVMLRLVENLLSAGEPEPIIILQSDHGSRSSGWEDTAAISRERVPILQALYLPGVADVPREHLVSPVNTFRFVFSHYFGAPREFLPNHSYFSPPGDPYGLLLVDSLWTEEPR